MLGKWRNHKDYQQFVSSRLGQYDYNHPAVLDFLNIISKLYILNLDKLRNIIADKFSTTGRPANLQPEFFRIIIMMQALGSPINKWTEKLKLNFVLRTACGLTKREIPSVASLYNFIYRIVGKENAPVIRMPRSKPKYKLAPGQKLPPKHPGITSKLKEKIIKGHRFNDPVADATNKVLSLVVGQSIDYGLLNDSINIYGDGTCMTTGASPFGRKTCGCNCYKCDCPRRFTDPLAAWGWDSHANQPFYGYTGYFISTSNKTLHIDLPLYLRVVDAKRHDSVSAIVSLSEFRDIYPMIKIASFVSDSASDNYATYELLDHWGINAVIALNPHTGRKPKCPCPVRIDDDGTPICPGGRRMAFSGNCKGRKRIKWRCPRFCGKAKGRTEHCLCSDSSYGRVVYTKPEWDLRLFCNIPRGSDAWKNTMKERSAAERVNNRILNDYSVGNSKRRGKKRIFFFTMVAAFNIHLDAQLKVLVAKNSFDLLNDIA